MSSIAASFQRLTSLGFWGGTCALFSLLVASGNLFLGSALLVALLLFLVILAGPQIVAMLWLMGSPTVFGFANQVLSVLPFITVERVMFVVLSGIVALKAILNRGDRVARIRLETLILVFLLYALVSLGIATDSTLVRQDLWFYLQYAMPMLMFLIGRRIEWSEQGVKMLLGGLTVTGVVLAVSGILQELFNITVLIPEGHNVTVGHVDRAHGAFSNAHTYIASLTVLFCITVLQFGVYRDGLVRFCLLLAMMVMGVGILLGQTRAPWGGAALALFIIMVRDRSVRPLLVTGGVAVLIGGCVAAFVMVNQLGFLWDRVTDLDTMVGRLATWATAVNMIVHNPVFGLGFGAHTFVLHKPEYFAGIGGITPQEAVYLSVPHNEYIHVAVLLGITGLVLFVWILAAMVRLMLRAHVETGSRFIRGKLGLYVAAVIIGLLFNSMFSDTYLQDYFWLLTYFLAGVTAGLPGGLWCIEGAELRGRVESAA